MDQPQEFVDKALLLNTSAVRVNKVAYGVLAILLGNIGIHHFYARKILWGILSVLFCWTGIPGIIGVVQGILALIRSDEDERGNIAI